MKICWLNQYKIKKDNKDKDPEAKLGGAETTIDLLIKKGKELGHEIELITPSKLDMKKIKECDLVIFSNISTSMIVGREWVTNCYMAGQSLRLLFKIEDLDWIIENKKFIKMEHDALFCKFRNVQCKDICPIKHCRPNWYRKLFKNSKLNIFLSPLQVKLHRKFFFDELTTDKIECVPPCVKKSFMKPSESARIKGTYCVVGAIYPGKGIEDILTQYSALGKNLRFIGSQDHPLLVGKINKAGHTLVASMPYDKMATTLQKYEYMIISRRIHKKDNMDRIIQNEKGETQYQYMNEGFGRIIPEALGCGIKILVDKESKKRIGAYSYNASDEAIVDMCDIADETFWRVLEQKGLVENVVKK